MIKKRDIVDRAFKLLSMSGFVLDDFPEDEVDILEALDDMMADEQAKDYDFGYIISDLNYLDDESGIKRDAVSGISHKLAIRVCSLFGKTPPVLLVNQADDAWNSLLTTYQTIPEAQRSGSTMQFGAGNRR